MTTNASSFFRVPESRHVAVGNVAELNWGYHLSDENMKAFKAVQLSCPTYNHHQHKILWRLDSKGNQFTDSEYASRLSVSDETKAKRHNHYQTKRYKFKVSNVIPEDERYYEFKIELGNSRKNLRSRVFLGVYGKILWYYSLMGIVYN